MSSVNRSAPGREGMGKRFEARVRAGARKGNAPAAPPNAASVRRIPRDVQSDMVRVNTEVKGVSLMSSMIVSCRSTGPAGPRE